MQRPDEKLPWRERQILEALFQCGEATVAEVMEKMPDPPSYSAVRATLRVLEDKGHVRHRQDGPRYVYLPAISPEKAKWAAMKHLVQTFFNGSTEQAMVALAQVSDTKLSDAELRRLAEQIRDANREGR